VKRASFSPAAKKAVKPVFVGIQFSVKMRSIKRQGIFPKGRSGKVHVPYRGASTKLEAGPVRLRLTRYNRRRRVEHFAQRTSHEMKTFMTPGKSSPAACKRPVETRPAPGVDTSAWIELLFARPATLVPSRRRRRHGAKARGWLCERPCYLSCGAGPPGRAHEQGTHRPPGG